MSDWVVIVHEYVSLDPPWLSPEDQPPPYHAHYTPIFMSQYVPLDMVLFVAETNQSEVPIFCAAQAERALHAYTSGLPPRFEHVWLPISTGPHDIKPYSWLLDHFDVQALHGAHLYHDHYITPILTV